MSRHIAAENDYRTLRDVAASGPLPAVSVVIPVYNRPGLLHNTVAALAAQTFPADLMSVVVADDGSEEDVTEALRSLDVELDVRVVRRERDGYGAGQARNLGAASAPGEVLVFVDADCIPDPELVGRHVDWHRRADNLVVIGARRHLDAGTLQAADLAAGRIDLAAASDVGAEDQARDDWRRLFTRRTADLVHGDEAFRSLVSSNFSVRRSRFLDVGGFSEDFHRWGGEDTELGWRLSSAGMFFVPENGAVVYHQTQEDAGEGDWRGEHRRRNEGLIANKIPHRFYRDTVPRRLYEVPKLSWVVDPPAAARAPELWDQLLAQTSSDWEALWVDDGTLLGGFAELLAGDPRAWIVPRDPDGGLRAALLRARGEYVALLHGAAAPDHRLAGRSVRHLDRRPRCAALTCGYRIPAADGARDHRRTDDRSRIDEAWRADGLPVFALARRRAWRIALGDDIPARRAWQIMRDTMDAEHLPEPMVALPAETPPERLPDRFPGMASDRTVAAQDLRRSGPAGAVRVLTRYGFARMTGRPYAERPHSALPDRSATEEQGGVPVRYVGWTGHDNLGDEAMLAAVRGLLPWADLSTSGTAGRALLLGGGTLINRGYLRVLAEHDSPRVERAVFGTGVANPEFWGSRAESTADWVAFLDSCCQVGVRGPISARLLRAWGYRGSLEVLGDPALALVPPAEVERHPDRVVVSPAWTKGLLWGGDDQAVYSAMAGLVKELLAEGRDVHMLSCHPIDDRFHLQIMRAAGAPDLPYLAGYADMDAALRLLASAGTVVAERLHAAVLGAVCGTPSVALEYRPKLRDFAASVEQDRYTVRTDDVHDGALLEALRLLDREWSEASERLATNVDGYRTRLAVAAAALQEQLA